MRSGALSLTTASAQRRGAIPSRGGSVALAEPFLDDRRDPPIFAHRFRIVPGQIGR